MALSLPQKLKLKPHSCVALLHAPEGYLDELAPLPEGVTLSTTLDGTFDWIQIFVKTKAEADALAPQAIAALKPESILWISFPKGTSKIQTDLTRDKGWDVIQQADLKWVNLISVHETWSAFAMRSYKAGEARQSFR